MAGGRRIGQSANEQLQASGTENLTIFWPSRPKRNGVDALPSVIKTKKMPFTFLAMNFFSFWLSYLMKQKNPTSLKLLSNNLK
jgi:hypothetical protein